MHFKIVQDCSFKLTDFFHKSMVFKILNYRFVVLLVLLPLDLSAQDKYIDSMEYALKNHVSKDTIRINLLNEIASKVFTFDANKTYNYAQEAYKISEDLNFDKGKAESLRIMGLYYRVKSDYKKTIELFEQALAIYEKIDYKKGISLCLNNLGSVYGTLAKFDLSIQYFEKAIDIQKHLGDEKLLISPYINLGASYISLGNYPRGIEYYLKSLKLSEKFKDSSRIAHCYANLGSFYKEQKKYELAIDYIRKSLAINEKLNINLYSSEDYLILSSIYIQIDDYDSAFIYIQKSLDLKLKMNDKAGIASCYGNMGIIYKARKDYTQAIELFNKSIAICKEIDSEAQLINNLLGLSDIYLLQQKHDDAYKYSKQAYAQAQQVKQVDLLKLTTEKVAVCAALLGLFEEAYKFQVLHKSYSDKYLNEDNIKKITGLEYTYTYEKEKQAAENEFEKKVALKNEQIKQQKIITLSLVIGFVLLAIITILIFRLFIINHRKKLILAKQKNEIEEKNVKLIQLNNEIESQKNEIENILTVLLDKNNIIEDQNVELKKLNATKDKFFNIIAHDLRGPIGSLVSFLEFLTDKNNNISQEKLSEFLVVIKDSAKSTYNLLKNLLTWAKSQRGEIDYIPTSNNLNELILSIVDLFEQSARQKNISIQTFIPEVIVFSFDLNMINTVIRNLLNNAIKFTQENGIIIISANKTNHVIEIQVKDSGVGIASYIMENLFKIDIKQQSTLGTKGETGTGLGLILCKEFIEKHGGNIRVESELGVGSTFIVTLPLDSEIKN